MTVNESDAVKYLIAYGYLPEATASLPKNRSALKKAIVKFQDRFGDAVPTTGEIDNKTLQAMEAPRCGCPDFIKRSGPAKWQDRDWKANPIKYQFDRFLTGIPQATQVELMAYSVEAWNKVIGLPVARQAKKSERADVTISTGRGRRDNFDGPGRTLAWAFVAGNTLKFDEEEIWVGAPSDRGIPYGNVGSHEWGHILGLDHSLKKGALMEPFMNAAVWLPVSPDDIEEAQLRYPGGNTDPDSPVGGMSLSLSFDASAFAPRIDGNQIIFDPVAKQMLQSTRDR